MSKDTKKEKIVLGITGSFGSGKSTVAKVLRSFGAEVIDADKIAHQLLRPGNPVYKKIAGVFDREILRKSGAVDRKKLGRVVFNDQRLRRQLNKIIHPEIIRRMKSRIRTSGKEVIVLDAPLLIEAGLKGMVDKLIVVKIGLRQQLRRLGKKTRLTKEDILKRKRSQISLREKMRLADFIIDNSGTIKQTKKQVAQLRRLLWKN